MAKLLLIKYGELTTKKNNRKLFINILENNIYSLLKDYDIKIKRDLVRMFITVSDEDLKEVLNKLTKIFDIHGIVVCESVNNNIEEIEAKIKEILFNKTFNTFKIETKRANKNFPFHTMELNEMLGSYVLKNFTCQVDVHNPDLIVIVEIRNDKTFIYTDEIKGSGGYPVGVQGKGLLMLSGGIDSPVAGYLALKRGITVECVYFDSPPHTSEEAKNKVIKLCEILNEYSGTIKLHIVPFTKLQEAIYSNVPDTYMITIMRRMMYRITEKIAKNLKAKVIINGESIGQVASQTIDSISVINEVTNMPVIRPVACLDKLEIIEIAKKIGTYETSILPYEDCCTIFVPKHPVINPSLDKCKKAEEIFSYEALIDECVSNIKTITNFNLNEFEDVL